jgi:hypothetical protein
LAVPPVPFCHFFQSTLVSRQLAIILLQIAPVIGDRVTISLVMGERRFFFPTCSKASETAERKGLDKRFFEPLARAARFGEALPAIRQHVAEFVAELICQLRPRPLSYVYDDPCGTAHIAMQPNRRRSRAMLVDADAGWLTLRKEPHAV